MPTTLELHITMIDECLDPGLMSAYARLLSPDEVVQHARFRFQQDRDRYLVTRALQRTLLADKLAEEPHALRFERGGHGKPRVLHASELGQRLSFNLSHTRDAVVMAVALDCDVGVDIERSDAAAPLEVMGANMSESEAQAVLGACQGAQQDALFWSLWTLKECVVKATGEGLHAPLRRFGFELDKPSGRIAMQASAGTPEDARTWWFAQWAPTPCHLAAIGMAWPRASDQASPPTPHVSLKTVIPLVSQSEICIDFIRRSKAAGVGAV
jgi:4'-phosphopantetheinyl transferase